MEGRRPAYEEWMRATPRERDQLEANGKTGGGVPRRRRHAGLNNVEEISPIVKYGAGINLSTEGLKKPTIWLLLDNINLI